MIDVSDISSIISQLSSRKWDPIHAIRIVSNFYARYKNTVTPEDLDTLKMYKVKAKGTGYANFYQLLIYLLSGRDKAELPEKFEPTIVYTSANWRPRYSRLRGLSSPDFDKDLMQLGLFCSAKEFT